MITIEQAIIILKKEREKRVSSAVQYDASAPDDVTQALTIAIQVMEAK